MKLTDQACSSPGLQRQEPDERRKRAGGVWPQSRQLQIAAIVTHSCIALNAPRPALPQQSHICSPGRRVSPPNACCTL